MKNKLAAMVALAASILSVPAFATPSATDYSTLTAAVDWSTAITALMAVAALVAGVLVVRKGIRFVLGALR